MIGVPGAKIRGFVTKIEASGVKIGPLELGLGMPEPRSWPLGSRLVAQGPGLGALGP